MVFARRDNTFDILHAVGNFQNIREFHGSGHLSRVGLGQGDPNRTVIFKSSRADPFRPFSTRESPNYLLTRSDSIREIVGTS